MGVLTQLTLAAEELETAKSKRDDLAAEAFKGHTQEEIAQAAGMSQPGVSKMLKRLGLGV